MLNNEKNFSASDIMVRRLITLDAEMDVFKAIELLSRNKISGAPVIDSSKRLLGMFTEKSCLEVMVDAAYEGLPANEVGAFMSEPADTIAEETGFLSIIYPPCVKCKIRRCLRNWADQKLKFQKQPRLRSVRL